MEDINILEKFFDTNYHGYALDGGMKDRPEYKKQLLKDGFDNTEIWNLNATICRFILPRLKEYKNIQVSSAGYYKTSDRHIEVLNCIIEAIEIFLNGEDDNTEDLKHFKYALSEEGSKKQEKGFRMLGRELLGFWT